ncbi:UDP-glucose dehydrogenase family protein [Caldimonas tepidiphila]|uniref:UDP-glucose dehydrogenase family protein n=1 Tax=Caldimonas tepidiphila TaxID=2315841 RepID=UPI0013008115|nr:UDP-glucose/GDP-mannose dehydrogenase family protein [Caldimonas tepidiphila]
MRIAVIGTGRVGLVCAAGLAQLGHDVASVDADPSLIGRLERGALPLYEPGLDALVAIHRASGRLAFTADLRAALAQAEVVFIAVERREEAGPGPAAGSAVPGRTAPEHALEAERACVLEVARALGRCLARPATVVLKSAAPVGTCERLREAIDAGLRERGLPWRVPVLCNPEFLRGGSAVRDFLEPGRIVVGADAAGEAGVLRRVYAPLLERGVRLLCLGLRSAELGKQAVGAMLAARISFINEMAAIAHALDADIAQVCEVLGSDPRIGPECLRPGIGWGGAGFPRDLANLRHAAAAQGLQPRLIGAAEAVNETQRHWLYERLCDCYGGPAGLRGRRIALWGLACKPGSDEMRDAPSLWLARRLVEAGAHVAAYDPVALRGAARRLDHPPRLHWARSARAALQGAQALVLATEWPEFLRVDPREIARELADGLVIDGRNLFDAERCRAAGLRLLQVGRPALAPRPALPGGVPDALRQVAAANAEHAHRQGGPAGGTWGA